MKSQLLLNIAFLLVLAHLFFFYNLFKLRFGIHFDFLFVFPYTYYYYKRKRYSGIYFNNKYYKNFIIIFIGLVVWNVFSVLAGIMISYYDTTIKGLLLSLNYFTMLIYLTFGAVLSINSKKFNMVLILHIVSITLITIVLFEYINPGFSYFLKQHYNVFEEMRVSSDPNAYRLVGTFRSSMNLGLIASMLLFLILFNDGNEIIKATISVGFFIVIFLSGSRTGFGLLIFIGVYYTFNFFTYKRKVLWIFLIILIGFIAINYIDIMETILAKRLRITYADSMFEGRQTVYWNKSIKIILDSPILGIGSLSKGKTTVDNFYLRLLQTNGIVGFLLWGGFLFQLIIFGLKYYFNSRNAKILIGFTGIVILSSITIDYYFFRLFYPFTMIIIGYYFYELLIEKDYFKKLNNKQTKVKISQLSTF